MGGENARISYQEAIKRVQLREHRRACSQVTGSDVLCDCGLETAFHALRQLAALVAEAEQWQKLAESHIEGVQMLLSRGVNTGTPEWLLLQFAAGFVVPDTDSADGQRGPAR